jgi:dihydroxy-acid dehydratase
MEFHNVEKQWQPEEPRYVEFPHLPDDATANGEPVLNKFSSTLTKGHDYPAAQAMLYAAGVPDEKTMKNAPHVGIGSVWWEGNPCKYTFSCFQT